MLRTEAVTSQPTWDFGIETTLLRVLAANAREYPIRPAMREKDLGVWQQTSWAQMLESTLCCAAGLAELGFQPQDALLVLGDNRPHLYMGLLAASSLGGYPMPVYPDATPDEVIHFTQEAHARFALAEDQEQVDKMLGLRAGGEAIEYIVYDDPRGLAAYLDPGLVSWDALITRGAKRLAEIPGLREDLIHRSLPDGPAVLVHSSGTTGKPKGALGTHRNIVSNIMASASSAARSYLRRGEMPPAPDPDAPQKGTLLSVPFFHATGCHAILSPSLFSGAKLALMRKWDVLEAMALIERARFGQDTQGNTTLSSVVDAKKVQ
jgi:acyl-CoA synthetase (AMP-forming)/AMP-acid ligase II